MDRMTGFWFQSKEEVIELFVESNYDAGFECVCSSKTYECGPGNCISCCECSRTISLTARTFFHRYKVGIEKLALILFHFWSNPNVAAFGLARQLEMPFTTVWRILHKLRRKVKELFPGKSYEEISWRLFAELCFKRSDESPTKTSFSEGAEGRESRQTTLQPTPPALRNLAEAAGSRLRKSFQGVSRKHLQQYLFPVFFEPVRTKEEFKSFFRSVLRSSPIADEEIERYSSPELLLLPCPV